MCGCERVCAAVDGGTMAARIPKQSHLHLDFKKPDRLIPAVIHQKGKARKGKKMLTKFINVICVHKIKTNKQQANKLTDKQSNNHTNKHNNNNNNKKDVRVSSATKSHTPFHVCCQVLHDLGRRLARVNEVNECERSLALVVRVKESCLADADQVIVHLASAAEKGCECV